MLKAACGLFLHEGIRNLSLNKIADRLGVPRHALPACFGAKRELAEECGLTADRFVDLGVVYPTVGYDSEKIYLWAATGLHNVSQHLDEDEFLDVVKMPLDDALRLVLDGTIKDSKTQIGILKYAMLRDKK